METLSLWCSWQSFREISHFLKILGGLEGKLPLYVTMSVRRSVRPSIRPSVRPKSLRFFRRIELKGDQIWVTAPFQLLYAPAHPHATDAAVYTALFLAQAIYQKSLLLKILTKWMEKVKDLLETYQIPYIALNSKHYSEMCDNASFFS